MHTLEQFCKSVAFNDFNIVGEGSSSIEFACGFLVEATLLKAGADVVQCDKFTPEAVKRAVDLRDKIAPNAALVASGGINLKNVREFAATGADALVTSAMYTQGMADITAVLEIV